jgi:NTP pyrophosphatase (non-canonical NTP hydrolase)
MMTSSSGSPAGDAVPSLPAPGRGDDVAAQAAWRVVETALPGLRSLQRTALGIYGRLEPDRALVWAVEELGELAQAVRRGEGRARVEEELGQLTAWMLCLANILGVDLTAAVGSAIRDEIDRQLAKYGKLRPYQGGCVS